MSALSSPTIEAVAQITTGAAAAALPAPVKLNTYVEEIIIQADPTNTAAVLVGDATRQVFALAAGASLSLLVRDPLSVFLSSAAAQKANVIYRGVV